MNSISIPLRVIRPLLIRKTPLFKQRDIESGLNHTRYPNPTSDLLPPQPCRLPDLPAEPRLAIYELALVSPNPMFWQGEYSHQNRFGLSKPKRNRYGRYEIGDCAEDQRFDTNIFAPLLTCRTSLDEGTRLFYRRNDFCFPCHNPGQSSPTFDSRKSLRSFLPLAFKSEMVLAHVQYVTFSYLDPYTDVEWEGYFDQARGVSWTHVKEIARNCVALKTYVVHGPIIAADVPKS